MECKKCKCIGTVVLRKKDYYCSQCFITNVNHKFRASIGKNKVFSSTEKVLVGLSGGLGSSVLLDLVHDGVKLNTHKILRIIPVCLHITGFTSEDKDTELLNTIKDKCTKYGFDLYTVHISNDFNDNIVVPINGGVVTTSQDVINRFNSKKTKMSKTEWNDFIEKKKQKLYVKMACILQCSCVFTGETTTTLACNLLSNIGLGRGAQLHHDVGFSDTRHETVKVLRPMKDITKEELSNYAAIKLITCPLPQEENKSNMDSLQSLINSFVVDLQENYSATISTVCKTAEKIGSAVNECDKRCFHCQSDMNIKEDKLTAQEATSFSKVVCLSHPQQQKMLEPQSFDDTVKQSLPLYCYSCSRNKAFSIS